MKLGEGVQDYSCKGTKRLKNLWIMERKICLTRQEYRNGHEESSHGAHATDTRLLQVFVAPPRGISSRLHEFHREQELDRADEEAAQVQGQGECT